MIQADKMHTATEVANWFLAWEQEESGQGIEESKLHAMLYYAQGYHLAHYGKPLFEDEIIATEIGPWVPTLNLKNTDKQ